MESSDIVASAKANLARSLTEATAFELPDAGWRWASYQHHIREQIDQFSTPLQVIEQVQHPEINFGYEARMTGPDLLAYAAAAEAGLSGSYPAFASALPTFRETELGHPATIVNFNGRLVSSALYNLVGHTLKCLSTVRPKTVVEIGGGYGAPGRIWMTNGIHNPSRYVDIDLPESLFFAEVFLRSTLPDVPLHYVDGSSTITGDEPGIVLCPSHRIAKLAGMRADIAVNTSSLQEMTDDFVAYYMRFLDTLDVDWFYSANYFGQPITSLKESMNFAAPVPSTDWSLIEHHLGGAPDRPSMQALFRRRRDGDREPGDHGASSTAARDLSDLFLLFDRCRFAQDADLALEAACSAVINLPYVPKESLYLARTAFQRRGTLPAEAMVRLLSLLADAGRDQMGIVTATLEATRQGLMERTASSGEDRALS